MSTNPRADPGTLSPGRAPARLIVTGLLRAIGSVVVLVAIYYLLPLDRSSEWEAIAMLSIGLTALAVLVVFQVRSIVRSPYPLLRAIQSLALSVPFFLLLFASAYVVMDAISAGSFSQPLSRSDSLYFTVTVFATVGFGDIVPKTETARLVVTGQMLADLVIIGLVVKAIFGAVRQRREPRT